MKVNVMCYYRGGSKQVSIEVEDVFDNQEVCRLAHEELKRKGAGFNSDSINFVWDEEEPERNLER